MSWDASEETNSTFSYSDRPRDTPPSSISVASSDSEYNISITPATREIYSMPTLADMNPEEVAGRGFNTLIGIAPRYLTGNARMSTSKAKPQSNKRRTDTSNSTTSCQTCGLPLATASNMNDSSAGCCLGEDLLDNQNQGVHQALAGFQHSTVHNSRNRGIR